MMLHIDMNRLRGWLKQRLKLSFRAYSIMALLVGISFPSAASPFSLVLPETQTTVTAGQAMSVAIDVPAGIGVRQVRYYWYRDDEEPMATSQAEPALTATGSSTPPYGGTLTVPDDAIGLVRLLAVGTMTRGRMAGQEDFDERVLRVDPPTELTGIEFAVEKPWRLDTIGKIVPVPVIGQFADNVERSLAGKFAGSRYHSSDESIVAVSPEGLAHVKGNGRAWITVVNQEKEGVIDVVVMADEEPNRSPIARVPDRIEGQGGQKIVLDGLQSRDPDGDPLRYEWKQTRGNKVTLMNHGEAKAAFMAPHVTARRLLQFKLRVTDMRGPDSIKGADSEISTVDVWIDP
ncbi:PKD domain-containing protein [Nitrospira sp. Nam80]